MRGGEGFYSWSFWIASTAHGYGNEHSTVPDREDRDESEPADGQRHQRAGREDRDHRLVARLVLARDSFAEMDPQIVIAPRSADPR